MAEVSFFMDRSDTHEFVSFLSREFAAAFTLDNGASSPLPIYRAVDEVLAALDRSPFNMRLAVTSEEWTSHPLSWTEIHTDDGRRVFAVNQRCGGPAFDLLLARRGDGHLVPGWLMDYPWYYTALGARETFARPEGMAVAYKRAVAYLRRVGERSTCEETRKAGPLVLPGAAGLHRHGVWLRQGALHFAPRAVA
jgi:hypothetical protein